MASLVNSSWIKTGSTLGHVEKVWPWGKWCFQEFYSFCVWSCDPPVSVEHIWTPLKSLSVVSSELFYKDECSINHRGELLTAQHSFESVAVFPDCFHCRWPLTDLQLPGYFSETDAWCKVLNISQMHNEVFAVCLMQGWNGFYLLWNMFLISFKLASPGTMYIFFI